MLCSHVVALVRCARRELGGNSSIQFNVHTHDRSSTSNCSVAFGGMTGGEPSSPYASSGGIVKTAFSPFFMVLMPKSHPFITCPIGSNNIVYFRNMHHFTIVYTLSKLSSIILHKENTHVQLRSSKPVGSKQYTLTRMLCMQYNWQNLQHKISSHFQFQCANKTWNKVLVLLLRWGIVNFDLKSGC